MLTWQRNTALEADQAANQCIFCEQYGHYPVDCPLVKRPEPTPDPPKDETALAYAFLVVAVVGLIIGMFIMKAFS